MVGKMALSFCKNAFRWRSDAAAKSKRPHARGPFQFETLETRLNPATLTSIQLDIPADVQSQGVQVLLFGTVGGVQKYLAYDAGTQTFSYQPTPASGTYGSVSLNAADLPQANGKPTINVPDDYNTAGEFVVFVGGPSTAAIPAGGLAVPTITSNPNDIFVLTEFTYNAGGLDFDTSAVDSLGFPFWVESPLANAPYPYTQVGNPATLDRQTFFSEAQNFLAGSDFAQLITTNGSGGDLALTSPFDILSKLENQGIYLTGESLTAGGSLTVGNQYYYVITAASANDIPNSGGILGQSLPSNIGQSPILTAGNQSVTLSWNPYASPNLDQYFIYRSSTGGPAATYQYVGAVNKNTTSFVDTGAAPTGSGVGYTIVPNTAISYGYNALSTYFNQSLYDFFHHYTAPDSFVFVRDQAVWTGNTILRTEQHSGTAQAGTATTVTLDTSAASVDDFYNGLTLAIVGGTGSGQAGTIADYNGATKTATMQSAWGVTPDATSQFEVRSYVRTGTAQAGAASTMTLDASAAAGLNYYNGFTVKIVGGTGAGQEGVVASYDGTTKIATMQAAWTTAPDATSQFQIWSDYTLLKLTGSGGASGQYNNKVVDIYEPFFSSNTVDLAFGGQPYETPPPPSWIVSGNLQGQSPSQWVFGNNGVFNSGGLDPNAALSGITGVYSDIENSVVSAIIRGVATNYTLPPSNWANNPTFTQAASSAPAGTSLAAGNYFYAITGVNGFGSPGETTPGLFVSANAKAGDAVTLQWLQHNPGVAIANVSGLSTNTLTFTTAGNHNLIDNDPVYISGVTLTGGTLPAGFYNAHKIDATTFSIQVATPPGGTYVSGGTVIEGANAYASYNIYRGQLDNNGNIISDLHFLANVPNAPTSTFVDNGTYTPTSATPPFQYYPDGNPSSLYAKFLHQNTISINQLVYAFPYDDQGGSSSNFVYVGIPPQIVFHINPWQPPGSPEQPVGPSPLSGSQLIQMGIFTVFTTRIGFTANVSGGVDSFGFDASDSVTTVIDAAANDGALPDSTIVGRRERFWTDSGALVVEEEKSDSESEEETIEAPEKKPRNPEPGDQKPAANPAPAPKSEDGRRPAPNDGSDRPRQNESQSFAALSRTALSASRLDAAFSVANANLTG